MPIIKNNPSPKRFAFPPKEEFERVVKRAQGSDRRTNILLHPPMLQPQKELNITLLLAMKERIISLKKNLLKN
jgi:hypothetical protein